jgi:hypothetical protein
MKFYLPFILSALIVIPAIIGWVRFHRISSAFLPFLILTWVGALNELLNFSLVVFLRQYNIVNTNLYQITEALLILWQFKRWRLFSNDKIYKSLFVSFIAAFLIENLIASKIYLGFNSYFHIFYSFIIVLLSIHMMNHILMKEKGLLLKNPIFIICSVFIIIFTYTVLVETFWAYGLRMSGAFRVKLQNIFVFINLLCNIIYTLAIVWMPKRQAFTLRY